MFSGKKIKCFACNSKIDKNYSFCPHCGEQLNIDDKDFGFLGKHDKVQQNNQAENMQFGLGITDKVLGSLINSLVKNLDKQFKDMNENQINSEVKPFSNGIKIRIGPPVQQAKPKVVKKQITPEQIERMSKLPRSKAKTKITRLSDKVVYELSTQGIKSPEDVFVSKLETGYEIKAIGEKKV